MLPAHELDTQEIVQLLNTDIDRGLSTADVEHVREFFGYNVLPDKPAKSVVSQIYEQLSDTLVIILLLSALFSFINALWDISMAGENTWSGLVDTVVILIILVLNAIVEISQGKRAETAINALSAYRSSFCHVIRSNAYQSINAEDLVPGDIIDLANGDRIPADCRILRITNMLTLMVDEAILTGESEPVVKTSDLIDCSNQTNTGKALSLAAKRNMLFSGTSITRGRCIAVVIATGENTEFGKIFNKISSPKLESPLKKSLDAFGQQLSRLIAIVCVLVWLINMIKFSTWDRILPDSLEFLKLAVALAVAAIPEGLSAVITICLSLSAQRMARNKAIIRSLSSVETLGCTTVICSDKTGTITQNKMTVQKLICVLNGQISTIAVSNGSLIGQSGKAYLCNSNKEYFCVFAECAALCISSPLVERRNNTKSPSEPTEAALSEVAAIILHSFDRPGLDSLYNTYQCAAELQFRREDRCMSMIYVNDSENGRLIMYTKGAPEVILEKSSYYLDSDSKNQVILTPSKKKELSLEISRHASAGLRVIGLACRFDLAPKDIDESIISKPENYAQFEKELTFLGFTAMHDPPRPGVSDAILECHSAGVKVIMVTGDNKDTAEAISKQIKLIPFDNDISSVSFIAAEFFSLPVSKQTELLPNLKILSRCDPDDKVRLVNLLHDSSQVVAMTGDGVNDAPALHNADIGIALGSGTDVAKLSSDMVLFDDNFATIKLAIVEGRTVFENIRKFIRYLVSSNIGEVVAVIMASVLGLPEIIRPIHLLWINLVTDGLPATALSFTKPETELMKQKPRSIKEKFVTNWLMLRYAIVGTYVGFACVYGYIWWFTSFSEGPKLHCFEEMFHFKDLDQYHVRASMIPLTVLVVIEMMNSLNAISNTESLMKVPPWTNMYLVSAIFVSIVLHYCILSFPIFHSILGTCTLSTKEWTMVFILSIPVIAIDESLKFLERQKYR